MYEIEILDAFLSGFCEKCGYKHAPIRDCPEPVLENDSYNPPLQRWE